VLTFNPNIVVMQATASYPCDWEELDLEVVSTYYRVFRDCVVGLSSHTAGIADGPPAYALGARVFEKHGTWSRAAKGTDHAFSLEPQGFRRYVRDLRRCEVMFGDGLKRRHLSEADPIAKMSQGLYFSKDLKAGHVLSSADLVLKTPGAYIPPYELTALLGKELLADVKEEQAVEWELCYGEDRSAV
jgi:N-acetylneuraminate synthase/sialic acid synthase